MGMSGSLCERQENRKGAAAALDTVTFNVTAILDDDLLRERQPQAGACRLGRKEGAEH
jgi:hypothetical protein